MEGRASRWCVPGCCIFGGMIFIFTIPASGTLAATPDLLQSEACDLGVTRTTAHKLTLIQKELLGGHRTKVWSRRHGQSRLQALERLVGSVALSPARSA